MDWKGELKWGSIRQKPDPEASWVFKPMTVFEETGSQYGLLTSLSSRRPVGSLGL